MQAFDGPGKALGTHRAAGSLGRIEQSLYMWRTLVPLATRLSLPHQPPAHLSSPPACGLPGHLPSVSPSTALTPLHQLSWAAISTLPQPPKKKTEVHPLLRTPGQTPSSQGPTVSTGPASSVGERPLQPSQLQGCSPLTRIPWPLQLRAPSLPASLTQQADQAQEADGSDRPS